jgi:hypothetical protein
MKRLKELKFYKETDFSLGDRISRWPEIFAKRWQQWRVENGYFPTPNHE